MSSNSIAPRPLKADRTVLELDMEYRYWGYLEGHPAHAPLSSETHTEAMDALKWSYTGTS